MRLSSDLEPITSAPRALRGDALRRALRRTLVHLGRVPLWFDETVRPSIAPARGRQVPPACVRAPAFAEATTAPDSGGPPALRPHELARRLDLLR